MKALLEKLDISKTDIADRVPEDRRQLEFQPGVNLLIGPNGSGKSTILQTLVQPTRGRKVWCKPRIRILSFDFEKENPRTQRSFGNLDMDINLQVVSLWKSHGEVNRIIHGSMARPLSKNTLLILDEPEQALDLNGLIELYQVLEISPAKQILVATHSPVLILHPGFNIIEMIPGYKQKVADFYRALGAGKM